MATPQTLEVQRIVWRMAMREIEREASERVLIGRTNRLMKVMPFVKVEDVKEFHVKSRKPK